jgi:hypothetical protein
LVIERQFPAGCKLGEFGPEAMQTGASEWTARREWQGNRPDMSRQVNASTFGPQGQQVRHEVFTEFDGRPVLKFGPASVDELSEVKGGNALPVPFGPEGIIEDSSDFVGEPILERPLRSTDGERQAHETPLSPR